MIRRCIFKIVVVRYSSLNCYKKEEFSTFKIPFGKKYLTSNKSTTLCKSLYLQHSSWSRVLNQMLVISEKEFRGRMKAWPNPICHHLKICFSSGQNLSSLLMCECEARYFITWMYLHMFSNVGVLWNHLVEKNSEH